MNKPNPSLGQVNKSGYPLQIALAHSVRGGERVHGWRVSYEEHAWRNNLDGGSGFIDLVLEGAHVSSVLLVECKRLQDTTYTFLPPGGSTRTMGRAKAFVAQRTGTTMVPGYPAWTDVYLTSESAEVAYCVVRRPGEARERIIESVASELVSAAEALEQEERVHLFVDRPAPERRSYFTAIVTTADLELCSFDPTSISLQDGLVPDTATFEPVNCVRFRKQLSTTVPDRRVPLSPAPLNVWDALATGKERTVFVIHATHLDDFLRAFEFRN